MIDKNCNKISISFKKYEDKFNHDFKIMRKNEMRLNQIFINIYDLNNLLNFEIKKNEITLNKPDYITDIKSFISYAIGCMFGRYSLDQEGLQFAGVNSISKITINSCQMMIILFLF